MVQIQPKRRRRRGVILTPAGLEKLQGARSDAEFKENGGRRYTLEALSERTGLAVDTLMKVFACETGVDKQTLKSCFKAFKLTLESNDYSHLELQNEVVEEPEVKQPIPELEPELPGGQVSLGSAFYVERFSSRDAPRTTVETDCYKAIMQSGALIRIKAPRRMGKTSLIARILHQATELGYRIVPLSFQLADKAVFQDLDHFLRWFCANVGLGLQLPNQLATYWDDLFGSKISCKIYFEQYLLAQISQPLVLALDDVDCLFPYPDLADEFFGLLRTWHEETRNRDIWKKLRLVVAHSTEVYIPLHVNKSPFNVGLPIELRSLSLEQVQDLAGRYGLDWSAQAVEQLMALVGGHPYLVQMAFYHLWHQDVTFEQLLQTAATASGIYSDHLQNQLWHLQQSPELATAFAQVIKAASPVELELVQSVKLQSMGLVYLHDNQAAPSCKLYGQYFRDRLTSYRIKTP
jgi:AAA-like domain